MKTFKKVLGVVLAIAMLAGVFSMMASALAPDSAIDLTLAVDKTSYSAGDEVVVTIYEQADAVVGDMLMAGQYAIAYNSAYIQPYSTTSNEPADHGVVDIAPGYDASVSTVSLSSNNIGGLGDWIEAADETAYGWDEIICYILGSDGTVVPMQSAPVAIASFKMKIDASCPDGDYVIGFNTGSYMNYNGWSWDVAMGGVYGYDDDYGFGTTTNYSLGTVTIHVGAAGPKVAYANKAGVKLNQGGYEVQLMIKSVITDADYDNYFFNTKSVGVADNAENKNKINRVGLVAFYGVEADFDQATAEALVLNGTAASGYKAADTDYIAKADADSDAYFGAILRGDRAGFENQPITFKGFVKYYDAAGDLQVIFYETAVQKELTTAFFTANS